jgi:hypothetical protein
MEIEMNNVKLEHGALPLPKCVVETTPLLEI